MRHDILGCVILVFAVAPGICAGGVSDGGVDANAPGELEGYLREAALNNAGLKAAFESWQAAVARVTQAGALSDPQLSYGYFIREVETRAGAQRHRFSLSQKFPWFGKLEARTDAAALEAKAAQKRYDAEKLKLFFAVKEAYFEYAYLGRAVAIGGENLELIKHFEEVARAKYTAAAGGHPDVIRAQIELARLEERLESLKSLGVAVSARLSSVLNRGEGALPGWPKRQDYSVADIARDRVVSVLKQENPELAALGLEAGASRSMLALARKASYPDIGLGLDWIVTDDSDVAGARDSGKDPVLLMMTLNLPVWRESYKAAEIEARARMRMSEQKRRQAENSLLARVEHVLYELEDSGRKARLYGGVLVPKAEELLGASEAAYRAGSVDFLSLLDAQRALLEYELLGERALSDNAQRFAELEMLAGAELSGVPK